MHHDITPWPVSERALAWPEDATEGLARLRPAPPRYVGRRRATPYTALRTVLAFCLSAALIWAAYMISLIPIWS